MKGGKNLKSEKMHLGPFEENVWEHRVYTVIFKVTLQ